VIRDIGGVETHSIYGGSFNSPYIGGAVGGAVGLLAPPKAPLHTVGGALQCTVGGSLRPLSGEGYFFDAIKI